MTKGDIKRVLENHKHWLLNDCDGWVCMKAKLQYADLQGVDLRYADLQCAYLLGANLHDADFRGANLYGADLHDANLRNADLRYANLRYANLQSADLRYANLRNADLRHANLLGANLVGANLVGAKNIPFLPMACPDFGAFIGWKKARDGRIVQLEIPADARRSSATGRKCRCDKAKVIAITCWNGNAVDMAVSGYDHTFLYRVGETVTVDNFCEDRWEECAPGIHFFINRQEAVDYED